MTLRRIDLNLVLALEALLDERSVTRAAARLDLTQPTLSASLARLRRLFDDPLLTRAGNDYQLTPFAAGLRERTTLAVTALERVFLSRGSFDPDTARGEYRILATDYAVEVLGPALTGILAQEAPGARLRFAPLVGTSLDRPEYALLSHHLLLMPHGWLVDIPHEDLFTDTWVCIAATRHPTITDEVTLDHMRTLGWVAPFVGPIAATPAARHLQMHGIEPHVQVITDSFHNAVTLVAHSDRIAIVQQRLMQQSDYSDRVRIYPIPIPIPIPDLVETMWWHPANDEDAENTWFRGLVRRAAHTLFSRFDKNLPGTTPPSRNPALAAVEKRGSSAS